MRFARKVSKTFPVGVRFAAFITSASIVALIGGAVYVLVTTISFAIFGGRMLVYPGVLGGMCTGYLLYFFKKNLAIPPNVMVLIIALCAGSIAFLSRWWLESKLHSVGLIDYLFEYGHRKSNILSVDAHGTGKMDSSPLWFWLFFLIEGCLTIYSSVKITRDGFLVP